MRKRKHIHPRDAAFVVGSLILVTLLLFGGLRFLESTVLHTGQESEGEHTSKTVYRDGVAYFPRQDITTVLVMGIDRYGPVEDSGFHQNPGATDMNVLLIFDEAAETCSVLHLNRDTMVEMPVLGIGGKPAGTWFGQLALSHTYGSGLKDSCENTRQAVSDLLGGIRIDYYISMNMDAIAILNDAVGGVTVEVTEDFSSVDPSIPMGTVTLMGEQALNYVRTRKNVGDQLNLSRIERHKAYIDAFAEAFREKQSQSTEFLLTAYEDVAPYLVSDCSVNGIQGMMDRYGGYTVGRVVSPEGENVMGEEYFEFYVNEEKLDQLILELFYAPKK